MGVLADDNRVIEIFERLDDMPLMITREQLEEAIGDHVAIVEKTLSEDFIMPDFQNFKNQVKEIYDECKVNNSGKVADYIPELAN